MGIVTLKRLTLVVLMLAPLLSFSKEQESKNQKVIDFEDELVEGVNKRPYDSLSQISEAEKRRRKIHLYRKRIGFRTETARNLQLMKYIQEVQ